MQNSHSFVDSELSSGCGLLHFSAWLLNMVKLCFLNYTEEERRMVEFYQVLCNYIRDGLKAPWLGIIIAILMTIKMMGANLVQSTWTTILKANLQCWYKDYRSNFSYFITCYHIRCLRSCKRSYKIVPLMSILYCVLCTVVILLNIKSVPLVLYSFSSQAFSFEAVAGGTGGFIIARAMQYGIARGMYSNEAEGIAPFAHGTAIVDHPVEEGITGVTEVFLDTIIICTMTTLNCRGFRNCNWWSNWSFKYGNNCNRNVWVTFIYIAIFKFLIFCFTTLMGQWFNAAGSHSLMHTDQENRKVKYIFPLLCMVGSSGKISLVWPYKTLQINVIIPNMIALIVLF